jgi:multidrug efflux pump subunit AcrB
VRFTDVLVQQRRAILFLLVIAVVGGTFSILRLPVTLFPYVDFPRIEINIESGERPAPQMEIQVTRNVEDALRSVRGVRNLRSTTSRGSAELSIDFAWGTDMAVALLDSEAKLEQLMPQLPTRTSYTARRMDPEVYPVMALSLTSTSMSQIELRDLARYTLMPALSTVDGVAQVQVQGGQLEEYRVSIDPLRMRAHALTIGDIVKALTASNVLTGVGRLEDNHRLYLVLSDTRFRSMQQILHAILKSGTDGIVELEDVATVGIADTPNWTRVTADGQPAVLMPVYQQPRANTVALGAGLGAKLADLSQTIPGNVKVRTWYDQGQLVSQAVASVRDAIGIGVGLAAAVLFLFLRSWKIAAIGLFVVPVVLAATGLLLYALGMSLNLMTLGGAAAAVGLIIDDSIVMIEHIIRRMRTHVIGDSGIMAVAAEMSEPLVGSSVSTIIIFLPLAFISGVTGAFFKALSLTMACALAISFVVASIVVPLAVHVVLNRRDTEPKSQGRVGHLLEMWYRASLGLGLQHQWLVFAIILPIAAIGYFAFTQVGSGFIPAMDEGGFVLDYRTPAGTSLTETDRILRQIGSILRATDEVMTYSRRTGLSLGGGLTEANRGDFFVRLKPPPRRAIDEVMAEIRSRILHEVPGVKIEMSQLIEDLIGDLTAVPQPIEIKLFSNDAQQLLELAPKVAHAITNINGIVDVKDGIVLAGDALDIKVDRDKAALEGVSPQDVTTQIHDALSGDVASAVEQPLKMVEIRAWLPQDYRDTVDTVKQLQLRANDGHVFSLDRIARVDKVVGQPEIDRENLKRMVAVTARVSGRSLGNAAADVETTLRSDRLIPNGVTYQLGGLYRQQRIAMYNLAVVFAAAVVLVFTLLLVLYRSFVIAAVIIAMPLLATGAVFTGLWLTGTERNIMAMMGLTMIIGIVTEIAIFYFSEYLMLGESGAQNLLQAAVNRFRPIAMTTTAAILALLPLCLSIGEGSAMLRPLAIAIISGLIVQIPLVLWVMPIAYFGLNRALHLHR